MAPRPAYARPQPAPVWAWARYWLFAALGLAMLLLAPPAMASGVDASSETPSIVATTANHGEECHHDTRIAQPSDVTLRSERHDSQDAACSEGLVPGQGALPHRTSALGFPRTHPDPSPLPIYLVTGRIRS
ncbi:hypothetical protein HOP62_07920 [Halomonas sp. MCCC 1A17488]|uniref:Uncharacterized protein n=1 Tax=Billgrantia sulfidoxydans TaxID=2733484 RepID=A0ABX7W389_9GAMM|nr:MULTISPECIES: hypothetical protein [Halomonas]MCE8016001.1 hypothetical protein [Halomonas sp. MCCC 1A17488]MCG3239334.1 hypothetical protein [Halomonas sp. MCCC 1A17488]QPP50735.1 hypothetical protein I4484_06465 [Halomonas sp. SS10-MC5]QTP54311.1 hypothetical protein HNO51_06180 [Halomonas sulfidoxydans]